MRGVMLKASVVLVGGVLVVPFAAAAALLGARAVADAGGAKQSLLLIAVALAWTLFGGVKGFAGSASGGREGHRPLAATRRDAHAPEPF